MKFYDVLEELLILENLGQERLQRLANKWGVDIEEANKYVTWFRNKNQNFVYLDNERNVLVPNLPQIRTFLYHFNIVAPEHKNFDINNIKNVESYSFEQIKFLYDEFNYDQNVTVNDNVFLYEPDDPNKINRDVTRRKMDASKQLWYGNQHCIINEGDFRVYEINTRQTSINFGYYLESLHQPPFSLLGMTWCTTSPSLNNNLYRDKRRNRSFYFFIDETKNPETHPELDIETKYRYLSAVQVMNNSTDRRLSLQITTIRNLGEDPISLDELIRTYPKIVNHLDKFKFTPFDESENISEDLIQRINENPGDKLNFIGRPRKEKEEYVALGRNLTKPQSWRSMDEILRKAYIVRANDKEDSNEYICNKFNEDLLEEVKKISRDEKYLLKRIHDLFKVDKPTLGYLTRMNITKNFKTYKKNRINEKIELCQNDSSKFYAIIDKNINDFYKINEIEYNSGYEEGKHITYLNTKDNLGYIVTKYIKKDKPDNLSFYTIINRTDHTKCFMLSNDAFDKLEKNVNEAGRKTFVFDTQLDPDIK